MKSRMILFVLTKLQTDYSSKTNFNHTLFRNHKNETGIAISLFLGDRIRNISTAKSANNHGSRDAASIVAIYQSFIGIP